MAEISHQINEIYKCGKTPLTPRRAPGLSKSVLDFSFFIIHEKLRPKYMKVRKALRADINDAIK